MADRSPSVCERLLLLAAEEYRTVRDYRDLAEEATDPKVRESFLKAAEDEERHFLAFMDAFRSACMGEGS